MRKHCLPVLFCPAALAALTAVMFGAPNPHAVRSGTSTVDSNGDVYSRVILQLGGHTAPPSAYPATVSGFQAYLKDCGVQKVSAAEMTRPHHPEVAARLGYHDFLPPQEMWPRGAALALLTQNIEDRTGSPVEMRNWWRPAAYNADPAVKGARDGDHPGAYAVDLDYPSVSARVKAEQYLRRLYAQHPWMQLSFGLGSNTTHVGIASPRGHREWHYAGWTQAAG